MPRFVVDKVREALNRSQRAVNGSRVLVLGAAYKRDIDDVRESPALDILSLLASDGASIAYHDPHVSEVEVQMSGGGPPRTLASVALTDDEISSADCVVIVTDHSTVDYARVASRAKALVDTRHAVRNRAVEPLTGGDPSGWVVKS